MQVIEDSSGNPDQATSQQADAGHRKQAEGRPRSTATSIAVAGSATEGQPALHPHGSFDAALAIVLQRLVERGRLDLVTSLGAFGEAERVRELAEVNVVDLASRRRSRPQT